MNQDLSQLTSEVVLILGIYNRTCMSSFQVLLYDDPAMRYTNAICKTGLPLIGCSIY